MSDLSNLTDEQLQAIYQKPDLSTISDADLLKAYGADAKPKFGLGDTWPARLAKSIYSAVTLPGDVYSGAQAMPGLGDRPESGPAPTAPNENSTFIGRALNIPPAAANPMDELSGRTLDLAGIGSPMSPAARLGVGHAGALKTQEGPAPTEEMLATATNSGYDAARNSPVTLKADAVKNLAADIQADLVKQGRLERFAPDTHGVLNDLQAAPADAVATGGNLISAREALREASRNFTNPREKSAAEIAIRKLDGFIENPPNEAVLAGTPSEFAKTASDARGNFAALRRSELLSQALEYADQNAAKANSGANVGNAERNKLAQIYQSDKKSAGFSADELAQTDRIIRGTPLANAARTAGNALGGGGGLGAAVTAGLGGAATAHLGGIGAAAPLVGYGLKKFSDSIGKKEISRLQEMVRKRSPLGESMPDRVVGNVSPKQALTVRALLLGSHPLQKEKQ
jgi:hypothetical protein